MTTVGLEEYFKYHPPKTEARRRNHELLNAAALEFAKNRDENTYKIFYKFTKELIKDNKCSTLSRALLHLAYSLVNQDKDLAVNSLAVFINEVVELDKEDLFLFTVQCSRMIANQGITLDEITTET